MKAAYYVFINSEMLYILKPSFKGCFSELVVYVFSLGNNKPALSTLYKDTSTFEKIWNKRFS